MLSGWRRLNKKCGVSSYRTEIFWRSGWNGLTSTKFLVGKSKTFLPIKISKIAYGTEVEEGIFIALHERNIFLNAAFWFHNEPIVLKGIKTKVFEFARAIQPWSSRTPDRAFREEMHELRRSYASIRLSLLFNLGLLYTGLEIGAFLGFILDIDWCCFKAALC